MLKQDEDVAFSDEAQVVDNLASGLKGHIKDALGRTECIVYRDKANSWRTGNSTVTSTPIIDISDIFDNAESIEVAVNFVSIRGTSGEPLHYHSSHLIGVIVKGEGVLLTSKMTNERERIEEMPVTIGDVVVIPRGAYHIFECSPSGELDYIALEFSDKEIDYQKHWR